MKNNEEKQNGSFSTIIEQRMNIMGISQKNFASQAQLSLFFKGNATTFLSPKSLDAALALVGINPKIYSNRFELANKVASMLIEKKVDNIDYWTKDQLADFTGIREISYLFDIKDKDEFLNMINSGIIDYESTYIHFRTLVSYLIGILSENINDKLSTSTAIKIANKRLENADTEDWKLNKSAVLSAVSIPFMFFGPIGRVVSVGMNAVSAGLSMYENSKKSSEIDSEKIGSQAGIFTLFQKTGTSLIGKALSLLK